jgi:hypothetical protein
MGFREAEHIGGRGLIAVAGDEHLHSIAAGARWRRDGCGKNSDLLGLCAPADGLACTMYHAPTAATAAPTSTIAGPSKPSARRRRAMARTLAAKPPPRHRP